MATEIFTPNELKMIIQGITICIEDLDAVRNDPKYPFTPESRKDMKDMWEAATSAKKKLEGVVNKGIAFKLDKYNEGDEKDFLTKES